MSMGLSYEELKREIESAPITWIPALIQAVVKRAITGGVFQPGGLERYVTKIIERMG